MKIITINPGSTSTKVVYFESGKEIWKDEVIYTAEQLKPFATLFDQMPLRLKDVKELVEKYNVPKELDAVAGRGGLIGPVKSGAILVDDDLLKHMREKALIEHASNLGAELAHSIVTEYGKDGARAYVYDPVTVDSMMDIARYTGLKDVYRTSTGHHLNMRAVARLAAEDLGKDYKDTNLIIVHLGGGSSASAHSEGEIIDFVSDDEIMFSAERSGGIPLKALLPNILGKDKREISNYLRNNAGLQAHLGTKDLREVEARILDGDSQAKLVLEAMALQIAKTIATLYVSLQGNVDVIGLTGGMAFSKQLVELITKYAGKLAPIKLYPGEKEMEALAIGVTRVLNKTEEARLLKDALK